MMDRLDHALLAADRTGSPVAVIFADLDRFKLINDRFGHAAGDLVLVEVARRLKEALRAGDSVSRLAGDEFVIVCDGLAKAHTTNLVARLGDALVAGLGIRISVGVADSRQGGSADDLLARADRAMYEDKRGIRRRLTDGPQPR